MTEKIKLTRDLANELEESYPSGEYPAEPIDGYVFVGRQEGAEHRWYTDWTMIVRRLDDGQLFESEPYQIGASESQENDFWSGYVGHIEEKGFVTFSPVVARPKVTTVIEYVSADKVPAPEPEPDTSDPRQIATDLIHEHARDEALRRVRDAVAERFDLKALGVQGYAAKVEEVREHIIKATVTVEIPDEVTA